MSHKEHQQHITILNECAVACNHCATACLEEQNIQILARCIKLDLDCADICTLTATWLARGSQHAMHIMKECAEICRACADECEKHSDMEHCKECADACRRCAEECSAMA